MWLWVECLYIGEFRDSEEVEGSIVSSPTGILEFRDKDFVQVDYFLERFPPRIFTVKLVYFIGLPESSYLCLIYYSVIHVIDTILMFVCLFNQWLFIIDLINNLILKFVNSINRCLNFLVDGLMEIYYTFNIIAPCTFPKKQTSDWSKQKKKKINK